MTTTIADHSLAISSVCVHAIPNVALGKQSQPVFSEATLPVSFLVLNVTAIPGGRYYASSNGHCSADLLVTTH